MTELKELLERLSEHGTPAGPEIVWNRACQRLATPPETHIASVRRPPVRRAPVVVAVTLILVVAIGVGGAVVFTRGTSRTRSSVVAGPTPASSTQVALDSEHTQTLLTSIDSQRGLEATSIDAGTTDTVVPGPMSLVPCNTCPLVRRGDALFFARDGRAYVLDDLHGSPRDLGPASFVFSGSDNRTVWIASTTRDSGTVTRLDEHGNRTGGPWTIPTGYRISLNFLPKEINGRILLLRGPLNPPHSLYAWDPKGPKRARLGNVLFTVDSYRRPGAGTATLAWIPQQSCRSGLRRCALTLTDLSAKNFAANRTRAIDPPNNSNGFIGGGAFSPDGRTLAAFVEAPPHQGPAARLVLIDVASGGVREVRGGEIKIGESYGFATWDPTGRWLFFGGLPDRLLVHRAHTGDAVALDLPASYTSAALAAPQTAETTASGPLCGATLPRPLAIPSGYTGPENGAVSDAPTPPSATQLVRSWKSASGNIEIRWPADAQFASVFASKVPPDASPTAGSGAVTPLQVQSTTSGRLFNYIVFQLPDQAPECQTLQLTAFDTDAARVSETINQIEQHPFALTRPLVSGSRAADTAPDVVPCPTPPGGNSTNRGGHVSGLGVYPTPEGALAAFVNADPTLIQFGYQEFRLPDGTIAYATKGPSPDWVTVLHVAPAEGGWTVDSWAGSGC